MVQTKYISLDEYQDYFGEDLRQLLGTEREALAFLKRIEDRMQTFLDANFNKNIDMLYPVFSDYQKEHYKRALLEQAIYIFKNGDISVDSGYDQERGVIADTQTIKNLAISQNSKQELILCGLWNRNLRRRRGLWPYVN